MIGLSFSRLADGVLAVSAHGCWVRLLHSPFLCNPQPLAGKPVFVSFSSTLHHCHPGALLTFLNSSRLLHSLQSLRVLQVPASFCSPADPGACKLWEMPYHEAERCQESQTLLMTCSSSIPTFSGPFPKAAITSFPFLASPLTKM